ncbi:MAG: c-type cytochrome [Leptospirales bacterium]|nr:c-type cytochrome [Leptospirales bacterium]
MADRKEYRDDEEIYEGRGWLPTWWTVMLWAGFAFAAVYSIYTHGVAGWSQEAQYREESAAIEALRPRTVATLGEDGANPLRGDAAAIDRGHKTFLANCAACHKEDATGNIGPNLTDTTWLHGNTDRALFALIMEGALTPDTWKQNPPKGPMPAHKDLLGAQKVLEVMSYLATLNTSLKPR